MGFNDSLDLQSTLPGNGGGGFGGVIGCRMVGLIPIN